MSHDESHQDHAEHEHGAPPHDLALRTRALESLLVEKGLVDPQALDAIIERYEHKVGPRNGAEVVARAWSDPDFAEALKRDATAAIATMGFSGSQGAHMVAVFNTPARHNLVVCTLCSCYPWTTLGLPPGWYKSNAYRSRAVIDPRGVLGEFGLVLAPDVQIDVWDSTAEIRYMVIPERPEGAADWPVERLQHLVSRNAMIGVEKARDPESLTP